MVKPDVSFVAITGGPCSGKTSVLNVLRQKIEDCGFDCYVLGEGATFLIEQGMRLKKAVHTKRWAEVREYQAEIIRFQAENERRAERLAEITGNKSVVVCDRGLPDSRAYLEEGILGDDVYRNLLATIGEDPARASERYKGVIKLTTTANGALEFYTLENNTARDETPEEAVYLDQRIEGAYIGHPHLAVIDNSTDFQEKKLRAIQALCRIIGIPTPIEVERKFKIQHPCFTHFPVPYRKVLIEQTYLSSSDPSEEVRVRRRTTEGCSTYYLTKKRFLKSGVRAETEQMIDWRTYYDLLSTRDSGSGTVMKERYCFLWENQYFELDIFRNLPMALCLLEIELTDLQNKVVLPSFLGVSVNDDVTENPQYTNRNLARLIKTA